MDLGRLKKLPLWLPPLVALLIGAGLGLLLRPAPEDDFSVAQVCAAFHISLSAEPECLRPGRRTGILS